MIYSDNPVDHMTTNGNYNVQAIKAIGHTIALNIELHMVLEDNLLNRKRGRVMQ